MDDRYERAKEVFLSVCDLPTARRREVLDLECGGDARLLAEVESLLAHHDEPPTATASMPPAGGPPAPQSSRQERHPESIGPYRVTRQIGRGGMGVVYLGVREVGTFKRYAAIKVVSRVMGTGEILDRFERERQVLAALNHPGIARLYDAGETEDGLPYFAMEYVEGEPIDEYCDTHRLRISERLHLFGQVCAAVQYVHQHLIVHRDLKPSNILVTAEGVPKLLDFGIAKALSPEMLPGGDPTAPDHSIMTVEYASPEQLRGTPITVASDIYSLGVILYQLVTGHRPYQVRGRVRAEVERVICEVDPERPSTASCRIEVIEPGDPGTGSTTTITPESVARPREGRPEKLRRRLSGDIDTIVLMAMRKEPQRRYQSAGQFREDIGRHLDGLPVIAHRDSAGYRLAKFARRHRGGVAAAAAVSLALLGWGVTSLYLWTAAQRNADRTRRMLDEVLELAHVFVFDFHDSIRRLEGSLPARKLLAETAQQCLEDLEPDAGDDPRLQRELAASYVKVGDIWGGHRGESWGDTTIALSNYRIALAKREALLDRTPDDPDLLYDVATTHRSIGDVLRFTGDVKGAWSEYDAYLSMTESLASADPKYRRATAIALGTVGTAHKDLGELEQARRFAARSLDVRRQVLTEHPDDPQAIEDLAVGHVHLGEALALLGDDETALERYRESIRLRARVAQARPDDGSARRFLALSHYYAADVLLRLDRPDEAAPHIAALAPILERRAEGNPGSVRAPLQDLSMSREIQGRLLAARGDHAGALRSFEAWRDGLAAAPEQVRRNTTLIQYLAESHEHIGEARLALGNLTTAVLAYHEALNTLVPLADADRDDVDLQLALARIRSTLGGALLEDGEPAEARGYLEAARSIEASVLEKRPDHARARRGLAVTQERLARLEAAPGGIP